MYIVILTYTAPLEKIDCFLEEHIAFLDRHYESGLFLESGRRIPRTGGVILTAACQPEILQAALAKDPFNREGLADYEIVEFEASKVRQGLEALSPVTSNNDGPE